MASNERAGRWARAYARKAQQEFVRRNWWLYAVFAVAITGIAAGLSLAMPTQLMRGLVLGAAMSAVPMGLWILTLQVTGTAPLMAGDEAEQSTAQELRRLRRPGWVLVNRFALNADDIDHVLLGPHGAYAVETKWSREWHGEWGQRVIGDAVRQVTRNARSLRLWRGFKQRGIPVTPLVVLWGPGLARWAPEDAVRVVDGVHVITGPALRRWFEANVHDSIHADPERPLDIDGAWAEMEEHVLKRDRLDDEAHPLPTSMSEWFAIGGAALVGPVAAFCTIGALWLRLPGHWSIGLLAASVVGLGVWFVRRLTSDRRVRWFAGSFAVASWVIVIGLLIAEAMYRATTAAR